MATTFGGSVNFTTLLLYMYFYCLGLLRQFQYTIIMHTGLMSDDCILSWNKLSTLCKCVKREKSNLVAFQSHRILIALYQTKTFGGHLISNHETLYSPVYTEVLIQIWIQIAALTVLHEGILDSNPDSNHLSHVNYDPDSGLTDMTIAVAQKARGFKYNKDPPLL